MAIADGLQPVQGTTRSPSTRMTAISTSRPMAYYNTIVIDDEDDMEIRYTPTKKRKRVLSSQCDHNHDGECKTPKKRSKRAVTNGEKTGVEPEEKRLRRFRAYAPTSFKDVFERAVSQRMFVLDRTRTGTPDDPEETIEIAGTTGNIYQVIINKVPSCTCPHAMKGNLCKHIVYVLNRTLKAPAHLQYQLALISSELRDIFAKAPPMPSEKGEDTSGLRKPIEDDCPICCVDFDAEHDAIVWCRAACGNNIHKACFEQWAAQKRQTGGGITCPFCRSQWEGDADMVNKISKASGKVNADGYVNVASQLGLSGQRDYSSYHSYWVNRQRRVGLLHDEDESAYY